MLGNVQEPLPTDRMYRVLLMLFISNSDDSSSTYSVVSQTATTIFQSTPYY